MTVQLINRWSLSLTHTHAHAHTCTHIKPFNALASSSEKKIKFRTIRKKIRRLPVKPRVRISSDISQNGGNLSLCSMNTGMTVAPD